MTCIVGLVDNNTIYIGGDSAGSVAWMSQARRDEKVFLKDKLIMGFTSSFRMGQLLHYSFTPPVHYAEYDLDKYMVVDFVDAVRKCLKDGGYAHKEHDVESGGTFLVGFSGQLFTIHSDYQVVKTIEPYEAIGSGEEIARGVLFATKGQPPEERITMALEAAQHFGAYVKAPFHILALEASK